MISRFWSELNTFSISLTWMSGIASPLCELVDSRSLGAPQCLPLREIRPSLAASREMARSGKPRQIRPLRAACADGRRARRLVELAQDVGDVAVHRVLADDELAGDLAVAATGGHVRQHLALAPRQRMRVGRGRRPCARAAARRLPCRSARRARGTRRAPPSPRRGRGSPRRARRARARARAGRARARRAPRTAPSRSTASSSRRRALSRSPCAHAHSPPACAASARARPVPIDSASSSSCSRCGQRHVRRARQRPRRASRAARARWRDRAGDPPRSRARVALRERERRGGIALVQRELHAADARRPGRVGLREQRARLVEPALAAAQLAELRRAVDERAAPPAGEAPRARC